VNFEKKMKSFIRDLFRAFNYQITRISDGPDTHIQEVAPTNIRTELLDAYKGNHLYSDFTDKEIEIINKVRKFTLTSPERIVSLTNSVK
jgi:hypothetical protein